MESTGDGYLIRNALTMETEQIPSSDLLDILFDGRNKDYGAYDLRKNYNRRLLKAIASTGVVCLLLAVGYLLAGRPGKSRLVNPWIVDTFITVMAPPPKELAVIPPKPMRVSPPIATIQNLIPQIVKEAEIKPEDTPPPTQEQLENAGSIGATTTSGQPGEGPASTSTGNGQVKTSAAPPAAEKEPEDFGPVEIESAYKGGTAAWQRFLVKNFRVPEQATAVDQPTTATVMVRFIVDTAGNVSNVEALSGPDLLRQEAVRIIKKSGQWMSAIQNGRKVRSYKQQPITVVLQPE
jgi:periplasmic protein TonB